MRASELRSIDEAQLSDGTRVLLRLDLNIPCRNGVVQNDYRIKRVFPTLRKLAKSRCRTTILSHLGADVGETLRPVFEYLKKSFSISFAPDLASGEQQAALISDGNFLLIENIRRESGEMENDETFAKRLSTLWHLYINDAFAVSHRAHASVVGVSKFLPSFAGFLVLDEVRELSISFDPPRPALFILGGAKFETKLPLLLKFLDRYDRAFVGGALANDIFKARGVVIGSSLVSTHALNLKVISERTNLRTPLDFVVQRGERHFIAEALGVSEGDRIVDSGPKTGEFLHELVNQSKFVLWNGPLGEYQKGFAAHTEELAKIIADGAAHSIVGGGDTITAIEKLGLFDRFGFVSTGGGAMLEFLANETLVGLEVLKKS